MDVVWGVVLGVDPVTMADSFAYPSGVVDDIAIDITELVPFEAGDNYIRPYIIIGGLTYYGQEQSFNTSMWTQRADFAGEAWRDAISFSINGKGYVGLG